MTLIRIPTVFFIDHEERALDTPVVVKETKTHFYIDSADPAIHNLYSDAEFYCDPYGPDADGLFGLKASARATMRALKPYIVDVTAMGHPSEAWRQKK